MGWVTGVQFLIEMGFFSSSPYQNFVWGLLNLLSSEYQRLCPWGMKLAICPHIELKLMHGIIPTSLMHLHDIMLNLAWGKLYLLCYDEAFFSGHWKVGSEGFFYTYMH
jgi:hypothetical protein